MNCVISLFFLRFEPTCNESLTAWVSISLLEHFCSNGYTRAYVKRSILRSRRRALTWTRHGAPGEASAACSPASECFAVYQVHFRSLVSSGRSSAARHGISALSPVSLRHETYRSPDQAATSWRGTYCHPLRPRRHPPHLSGQTARKLI